MRSGEHELWDAHLIRLQASARMAALGDVSVAMARVARQLGESMQAANEAMLRFARAYGEAMTRAAPAMKAMAEAAGRASSAERP